MVTTQDEVVRLLRARQPLPDNALHFQRRVRDVLDIEGWNTRLEVRVPHSNPRSARKGRIDIVAERDNKTVAIECDRITPRAGSVFKLAHFPATLRLILLRKPKTDYRLTNGICVVGIEVQL